MKRYKLNALVNPSGVLYNPISVAGTLQRLLLNRPYHLGELLDCSGCYVSLDHHDRFSRSMPQECLEAVNSAYHAACRQFAELDVLIITFGTAFVYEHLATGRIAANCHKLPPKQFTRRLLEVQDLTDRYANLLDDLRQHRPDLRVVVTVSPVRHLRDDVRMNQVSKARRLDFCYQLGDAVDYFPAYEIMMDDLRDYRFYAEDLVHPSPLATRYIWDAFRRWALHDQTSGYFAELDHMHKRLDHRPLHPESPDAHAFLRQTLTKLDALSIAYPFADFSAEKQQVKAQLQPG